MNAARIVLRAAAMCLAAGAVVAAEPAPPQVPGVNLFTPELLAARAAISNELAAARRDLAQARAAWLEPPCASWRDQLEQKRKTRNTRGIAIATAALEALEKVRAAAAEGPIAIPDAPRVELKDAFAKLRADAEALETRLHERQQAADERAQGAFLAAVRAQAPAAEAAVVGAVFDAWLTAVPPEESEKAAAPETPAAGELAAAAAEAENGVLAESSPGTDWETVAHWSAEIYGADVFEIPVYNRSGRETGRQPNPLSGHTVTWTYESLRTLSPADDYAWRLVAQPSRGPVSVAAWPRPRADGVLVVRVTAPAEVPAPVGFDLQVCAGNRIAVPVKTDPPGAAVFVNGREYRESGRAAVTPCTLRLPPGTYAIRLELAGYVNVQSAGFVVREGAAISAKLKPEKDLPGTVVRVDATRDWTDAGLTLRKGERVRWAATGQWGCGSKREFCGPGGYPNTLAFQHYYLYPDNSPRLVPGQPYGALVARVGTNIVVVGAAPGLVASEDGPLSFSINEALDPKARRDNQGALDVKILPSAAGAPARRPGG